jgi:signal transduction protein with GAF and PtsI domain
VRDVARHYLDLFADSPHPYIREKVSDIEDLSGRLLNNLVPSCRRPTETLAAGWWSPRPFIRRNF